MSDQGLEMHEGFDCQTNAVLMWLNIKLHYACVRYIKYEVKL